MPPPPARLAFIKGLARSPTDPSECQQLLRLWLGCYGLLLPARYPFLVGVAGHPEAEEAEMQVRCPRLGEFETGECRGC